MKMPAEPELNEERDKWNQRAKSIGEKEYGKCDTVKERIIQWYNPITDFMRGIR